MLRVVVVLFSLATAVLIPAALAVQIPLKSPQPDFNVANEEWALDILPNPNSTDHLVFETVSSLLQHWPNTRMRNGHNIVPGRISKGTLLYHGAMGNEIPSWPDWVATDPEHSYLFCRSPRGFLQQGCWHLTLITTRSLKVVYFDGTSAAKIPYGTLDTQDLLVWGRSDSYGPVDDFQRINALCEWGRDFGVDGFVRMEMDFEVMLCDFTSGVSVVSFSNLVSRKFRPGLKMADVHSFEVMNAGSWHNRFPGETRVQLDLAGLISFYDTQLAPSLIDIRAGQERWDHRVQNISNHDLLATKSRLESILLRPEGLSSKINWSSLIQDIVDRYAGRLELIHYLLNSSVTDSDEILQVAKRAQTQLRIMLTPYLLLSATPTNKNWEIPIYKLCTTTHTCSMDSDFDALTDSEKLLLHAVRGTTREICRVVTGMWAAGVYAGIDSLLNTRKSPNISEVIQLRNTWTEGLGRLMAWLDWNVWIKCNPSCGPEEMCYLPTWPAGFPRPRTRLNMDGPRSERLTGYDLRDMVAEWFAEDMEQIVKPGPDDWIRPQPRCIRRVEPYAF